MMSMNKKKIYISLPIAFQEDTVYKRNECAKTYLQKGVTYVTPFLFTPYIIFLYRMFLQ